MSSVIQMNGTRRESIGKGGARKARAAGQLPGVVYGHGEEPMAVAVDYREFMTQMRKHKGANPIVNLNLGGHELTALVRDAQIDPISQAVLHVDFQHISLTEKITVEVPIHPVGVAIGVKDGGGILEMIHRTLEIRCLPTAIPGSIDVDVTALAVGQALHVSDVKVEGIEILSDPETTLILIAAPTVEEAAAAVPGTTAEPEVVGAKGKKEEAAAEEKKK
ncbi:MAG: 50S ribosomal protein L25 [Candidatus Eisenbacteria bacterium]|uniref:Large ribosomal subunit protein bL25 n=1 Tax=Eiseniibacteriota bacterium TaxID=2212470 RepID=A0A933SE21_UNCEI|nr:50S ribosomal protein L25 [Candidatus Eisenbacteria bacterium]